MNHAAIWLEIAVATLLASYRPAVDTPPHDIVSISPPSVHTVGPESRDVVHFDAPIHSQATLLR